MGSNAVHPAAETSPRCELRLLAGQVQNPLHSFRNPALKGQHAGGEYFSRLLQGEGPLCQAPAVVPGHTQAIDVGLDAPVQLREVVQGIMGGGHGAIALQPQERCVVGVPGDDLGVDERRNLPGVEADRLLQRSSGLRPGGPGLFEALIQQGFLVAAGRRLGRLGVCVLIPVDRVFLDHGTSV